MSKSIEPSNRQRKHTPSIAVGMLFGIAISLAAVAVWIAWLPQDEVRKVTLSVRLARLAPIFALLGVLLSASWLQKYRAKAVLLVIAMLLFYGFLLTEQNAKVLAFLGILIVLFDAVWLLWPQIRTAACRILATYRSMVR